MTTKTTELVVDVRRAPRVEVTHPDPHREGAAGGQTDGAATDGVVEGLERLQATIGDFREMIDAVDTLREQIAASERKERLRRATRYERRTANLPRLGDGATHSTNSVLRNVIYAGTQESAASWRRRSKPAHSLGHS